VCTHNNTDTDTEIGKDELLCSIMSADQELLSEALTRFVKRVRAADVSSSAADTVQAVQAELQRAQKRRAKQEGRVCFRDWNEEYQTAKGV